MMPDLVVMVITACLAAQPGRCGDYRMPLSEEVSLHDCEIQGEFGLAQWAGNHPAFRIARWKCVTARTEREGA